MMMEIRNILFNEPEMNHIARLYSEIWGTSAEEFLIRFKRHATYPGFRGIVATAGEEIISLAYGYTSMEGQYYHEILKKSLSVKEQKLWLADCFELVELAVDPAFRRNKIGQALLSELTGQIMNKTAILTTQVDNLPARTMYEKLGWISIRDNFVPKENGKPYVIMGKELEH